MPYCRSLWTRRLWLTLLNALEKSMISTSSWHHFFSTSDISSTKHSIWNTRSASAKAMLLWMKNLVFFCIFHDGADYHMLKKLERYAVEGDEPVLFWLVSFPCDETSLKYIQIIIIAIKHDFFYSGHDVWAGYMLTGCLERDDNNWKYITIQVFHSISMKHFVQQHTSHKSNKDDLFSNVSLLCDHLCCTLKKTVTSKINTLMANTLTSPDLTFSKWVITHLVFTSYIFIVY